MIDRYARARSRECTKAGVFVRPTNRPLTGGKSCARMLRSEHATRRTDLVDWPSLWVVFIRVWVDSFRFEVAETDTIGGALMRQRWQSLLVLACTICLLVGAAPGADVRPGAPDVEPPSTLRVEMDKRELLGLPSEAPQSAEVDPEYGIELTASERSFVDAREQFAGSLAESGFLDDVLELPGFDAAYFGPNGDFHVRVATAELSSTGAEIRRDERAQRHVGFQVHVEEAEILYSDMKDDVERFVSVVSDLGLNAPVGSTSIEVQTNTIVVALVDRVSEGDLERIRSWDWRSGADVVVRAEEADKPDTAGHRIRRGSSTGASCTEGFHIKSGSTGQFLSAGHCSYGSKSNHWWRHNGNYMGSVQQNLHGSGSNRDAMRVSLGIYAHSNAILRDNRNVVGAMTPFEGLLICMSRGMANTVSCGSVTQGFHSYTLDGVQAWGYRHNIARTEGDSGSPIYQRTTFTTARAVGIHSSELGRFAGVTDVLHLIGGSWELVTN